MYLKWENIGIAILLHKTHLLKYAKCGPLDQSNIVFW